MNVRAGHSPRPSRKFTEMIVFGRKTRQKPISLCFFCRCREVIETINSPRSISLDSSITANLSANLRICKPSTTIPFISSTHNCQVRKTKICWGCNNFPIIHPLRLPNTSVYAGTIIGFVWLKCWACVSCSIQPVCFSSHTGGSASIDAAGLAADANLENKTERKKKLLWSWELSQQSSRHFSEFHDSAWQCTL